MSFKDELGEGSGVVRSFYTAISNAFLADEKLPNLDNIFSGTRGGSKFLSFSSSLISEVPRSGCAGFFSL